MAPAVLALFVYFKAVDIVFYSGYPIASLDKLRNDFFDQCRFSAVRFANNRNDGNHCRNLFELSPMA